METYKDIFRARIGRVKASAKADNYFPVVGDTVRIDAETRWGQSSEWQTCDGSETVTEAGSLAGQKDSKPVAVTAAGELPQRFIARNILSSAEVVKTVYAMSAQPLPYFDIDYSNTSEVIRAGSDNGRINLVTENGYSKSLQDSEQTSVQIRIYKENETTNPVVSKSYENDLFTLQRRGIYDVEVDVTDLETGMTLSKRINKLITVIPKLCPKPADTSQDYEVAGSFYALTSYSGTKWLTFEVRLWRDVNGSGMNYAEVILPRGAGDSGKYDSIPLDGLPAGTTLCVRLDPLEPQPYPYRLLAMGGTADTNENGTPNLTYDTPLVITHDCADMLDWGWRGYGAVQFSGNMRNVVVDGYGYGNTGIRLHPFEPGMFVDSCMYIGGGSSDIEIFGLDIDGAGFAGIQAKSDPNPNNPWYWKESGWSLDNLRIHHCTIRNTTGEGVYLGYFSNSRLEGTNSAGQTVSYHAHELKDLRLYRCRFFRCGFDSVQITNAVGVEVCHCDIVETAFRQEPNQASAFSCCMDGRVYNCRVTESHSGIGVIVPWMTGLYIYNNVMVAGRGDSGFSMTYWSGQDDEYVSDDLVFAFYNNVIKAASIAGINTDMAFTRYTMDDNIFITERGDTALPGFFTGSGNIFLKGDTDYEHIDSFLKVADSANDDYRPAHNSISVTAGKAGKALYDMNGYRNWFVKVRHAGPFMGKYKNPDIIDESLALERMSLDHGTPSTLSRTVSVQLFYRGDASRYRIGETADLSAAEWLDMPADGGIEFMLSDGFGAKTVYAQVASDTEESNVVSATIAYQATPLTLDGITVTGGNRLTVNVAFEYSGSYEPSGYRLGEKADLSDAQWKDYAGPVSYLFATPGEKTLYGQLRDADGNISEIKSAVVTVSNEKSRMVVSLGWELIGDNGYQFNDATGINEMGFAYSKGTALPWKWSDGQDGGTIVNNNKSGYYGKVYNCHGDRTGDDSGVYPDDCLYYLVLHRTGWSDTYQYVEAAVNGLARGTYRVRLFVTVSGTVESYDTSVTKYQLVADGIVLDMAMPDGFEAKGNADKFLEQEVTVTGDSPLLVRWGTTAGLKLAALNVIEIEEV